MSPDEAKQVKEFINEIFRKEAEFSEIALHNVRKTKSILFSRFVRRYDRFKPEIQREASRLIRFSILMALRKVANQTSESEHERKVDAFLTADTLFLYLYDSDLEEVTRDFKDYGDDTPPVVFCRNVWTITGVPKHFEYFVICCTQVQAQVLRLIEVFVGIIRSLTEDPNYQFTEFAEFIYQEAGSSTSTSIKELELLHQLESEKAITIGIDRTAANNYWSSTSLHGKIVNGLTIPLLVAIAYVFYAWGWRYGLLAIIGFAFFVKVTQSVGCDEIRMQMLEDEELFNFFYKSGAATVRVNATGKIIRSPEDWRHALI